MSRTLIEILVESGKVRNCDVLIIHLVRIVSSLKIPRGQLLILNARLLEEDFQDKLLDRSMDRLGNI